VTIPYTCTYCRRYAKFHNEGNEFRDDIKLMFKNSIKYIARHKERLLRKGNKMILELNGLNVDYYCVRNNMSSSSSCVQKWHVGLLLLTVILISLFDSTFFYPPSPLSLYTSSKKDLLVMPK
jgi:hypothetical protein